MAIVLRRFAVTHACRNLTINRSREDNQLLKMLVGRIVVRTQEAPMKIGRLSFNTLEDLDQPSVSTALWKGTGTEHAFVAKYKKAKIDSVVMPVTGANRLEDVLAKRVDAATLDSPRAHLVVHQYPQLKIIPGGPDSCIKNPDIPIPIGMAFNYGDAELKKFLEAVVADMQNELRASLQKHSQLEFMLEPK